MASTVLPRLIAITTEGSQRSAVEPIFKSLTTASNAFSEKQLFSSVHFGSTIEDFEDVKKSSTQDPLVVVMGAPSSPKVLEYLMTSTTSSNDDKKTFNDRVKLVHCLWTGIDGFDVPLLRSLLPKNSNIPLSNARGVYSHMLAEHVLLSILYFTRQVPLLQEHKRRKIWDRFSSPTTSGMTLLVAGFGEIGQACAQRAVGGLNMKVVGVRSARKDSSSEQKCPKTGATVVFGNDQMDQELPNADVVLAVLPNTAQTENTFNEERFAKFKKGSIFINIGRGKTVDDAALVKALKSDHLRGAALDVFDPEPLPKDSPFWEIDDSKLFLTPHNADVAPTMFEDSARYFASEVAKQFVLEGKLPGYLVDLEKGY